MEKIQVQEIKIKKILTPEQYLKDLLVDRPTLAQSPFIEQQYEDYKRNFISTHINMDWLESEEIELFLELIELSTLSENLELEMKYIIKIQKFLNDTFIIHDFNYVNSILLALPLKWLKPVFIMVFIRGSYVAKPHLYSYNYALERIRKYLKENDTGYDADKLLKGLDKDIVRKSLYS